MDTYEIDFDTDSANFIDQINICVEKFVGRMRETTAKDMGLDPRAAYILYVDEYHIVVDKSRDGGLQYYGGFEYVEKDCRVEIGGYVFYSAEDNRVYNHLSKVLDGEEETENN